MSSQSGDPEIVDSEWMGGNPDGFERLWTPHRMAYVRNASDRAPIEGEDQCPLCKKQGDDDRAHLVVHRGDTCYVVLNLFPYNPGHLMVCPYRHIGWYTEASDAERDEMGVLTQRAMQVLQAGERHQRFQHRHEPGRDWRCRHLRALAPARGAAVGRRFQFLADHRAHEGGSRIA